MEFMPSLRQISNPGYCPLSQFFSKVLKQAMVKLETTLTLKS